MLMNVMVRKMLMITCGIKIERQICDNEGQEEKRCKNRKRVGVEICSVESTTMSQNKQ
jgi:hypothetical protein